VLPYTPHFVAATEIDARVAVQLQHHACVVRTQAALTLDKQHVALGGVLQLGEAALQLVNGYMKQLVNGDI